MTVGGVRARSGLSGVEIPAAPTTRCATFIVAQTGGDAYWRAEAPARVLGGKVIQVPGHQIQRAFQRPNRSTALPWSMNLVTDEGEAMSFDTMKEWKEFAKARPSYLPTSVHVVFPTIEGTVIWQRPDMARAALAFAMQDQGIRTVGETDDNYFADASQNLFLRWHHFSDTERLHHARAMASQDACVFSTANLRDTYYKEMRERVGKTNIPELFVCRNHVPVSDWPERVERDGPIRVGFMGSPSHVWDVNLAYSAFHAARSEGAETIMVGYNPGNPEANTSGWDPGDEYRSAKSIEYRNKWKKIVSTHIPWVAPDEYHRAALPLDIGLCPLRSDSFTLGKSDVKAIEYTISGAAVICQNNTVYNTAGWKHEVNCLMAATAEDFGHATLRLMRDEKLRYELITAAQEMVLNERSDQAIRDDWEAVL